jgi:hypothetical protein
MILERKSLLIGAIVGLGVAAVLFAFKMDQMVKEKIIGELIVNNSAAERHKQLMQELKRRNNGKAKTKDTSANA